MWMKMEYITQYNAQDSMCTVKTRDNLVYLEENWNRRKGLEEKTQELDHR